MDGAKKGTSTRNMRSTRNRSVRRRPASAIRRSRRIETTTSHCQTAALIPSATQQINGRECVASVSAADRAAQSTSGQKIKRRRTDCNSPAELTDDSDSNEDTVESNFDVREYWLAVFHAAIVNLPDDLTDDSDSEDQNEDSIPHTDTTRSHRWITVVCPRPPQTREDREHAAVLRAAALKMYKHLQKHRVQSSESRESPLWDTVFGPPLPDRPMFILNCMCYLVLNRQVKRIVERQDPNSRGAIEYLNRLFDEHMENMGNHKERVET